METNVLQDISIVLHHWMVSVLESVDHLALEINKRVRAMDIMAIIILDFSL
jgi:hypothetical protein